MSTSERTPLLSNSDDFDSSRTLHEAESTLVDSPSNLSPLKGKQTVSTRNWVPDPTKESRARTLVLCFDGTGDQFDDDNSNVIQFLSCLKKDDETQQLVYYQAGIGTYTKSTFVTPVTNKVSKVLDEMIAWNLADHVQEGYEFLMQNYTAGDKVSIFGFSRGAYTARALAGMVQKVGLLPRYNNAQIPFAWTMYTRDDMDGLTNSVAFKKTFSTDITIDFVGVWDTVASVGIVGKELPFVGSNSAIRVFRHALALDEHRVKFMPNFYESSSLAAPREAETDFTKSLSVLSGPSLSGSDVSKIPKAKKMRKAHRSESEMWEASVNASSSQQTDALEVWFAGCHCDIGGGSVRNGTPNSLARIPLRWMIRQCFQAKTGIIFDADMLKENIGIDAKMLYPEVKPRPPRIPASSGATLAPMEPQPSAIVSFFSVVGGLFAIPLTIVGRFIAFPVQHFWLLLKFTKLGKLVRRTYKSGVKKIKAPFTSIDTPVKPSEDTTAKRPFVSEEEEEYEDALQPAYDQLSLAWFWWILEAIPFRFRDQKGNRDDYFVRANMGNGRKIYGDAKRNGIRVHRSVKTRLEVLDDRGKSLYKPRAWFKFRVAPKKKKEVGPQNWNVEEPENRQWEWVE